MKSLRKIFEEALSGGIVEGVEGPRAGRKPRPAHESAGEAREADPVAIDPRLKEPLTSLP